MTDVAVLVPWRRGNDQDRVAARDFVAAHYRRAHRGWRRVTGTSRTARWCKARAVATARAKVPRAKALVIADADVFVSPAQLHAAVQYVLDGAPWAVPHTFVYRLTREATRLVLNGGRNLAPLERAPYRGLLGGGLTVVRADVYDDCPLDARFHGWGGEDVAWGVALDTLHGPPVRLPGNLVHLWHAHTLPGGARHRPELAASAQLLAQYHAAHGDPVAMRMLVSAAR